MGPDSDSSTAKTDSARTRSLSVSWLAIAGLGAVSAVLVWIVLGAGELGHDEAAYALKARSWQEGTPDTGWALHRGIAQSALALVVLPFTQDPAALRLVSVALSLATVAAVWWLGRTMGDSRAGLVAAGIFAVAPSFLRRGAEFLSDLPSAGLLLLVAAHLWRWMTQEGKPADLLWATALGALAIYVRYQSILSLALLAVAVAVAAWEKVRRSRGELVPAAALGLGLLTPHFVFAVAETGTPWGIFLDTARAGRRQYLGEGLVDYATAFPDLLAGQIGAAAILAGVVWAAVVIGTRPARRPTALFLLIPALGQFLTLGLISHGEPRFVFFSVALLSVAGGFAFEDIRQRVSPSLSRALAWAAALALVASFGLHGERMEGNAEARGRSFEVLADTAEHVSARAGADCGIVTGYQPQLTWMSRCATAPFGSVDRPASFPGLEGYLVLFANGVRQPTGSERDEYVMAATAGSPTAIPALSETPGDATIWRLDQ